MKLNLPSYGSLVARGTSWCLSHAWTTFAATLALLAISATFAARLGVDPSPEAYLKDSAEWATFERIDRAYGIGETIVVAFREPGGTVFDMETVSAVAELDRVIAYMPGVKRVLSMASASVMGKVEGAATAEVIDVGPLLPPGPITQASATTLGARIARHPVYRRLLIDERHETTFLLVQLDQAVADPVRRLTAVREIRAQADRFISRSRSVHLAGTPVIKEAIAAGVQRDTVLFFPAATVLLTLLLWIIFGEFIASLIPICVVGFSSLLVLGWLGANGAPLTMATATVPTMILVVGLPDGVHFLAELRRQFSRTGDREAALVATVEGLALPCLLTAATAAIGFAALFSSRVGTLRDFGYASAVGLLVSHLASMFLTPVLLSAFGYPRRASQAFTSAPRLARVLTRVAVAAGRRMMVPIAIVGLLSGGCVAALLKVDVNSDFIGYLDPESRVRTDIQVIEHTLGGADTIEIVLKGGGPDAFTDPAKLAKVDELGAAIRKIVGGPGVFSAADYLKLVSQVMHGGLDSPFELPKTREEIAQMMLLGSEALASLTQPDMSEVRMTVQIRTLPSEEVLELTRKISDTSNRLLEGSGITAVVTGLPPMFARIVRYLVEDAVSSFGFATVMIWLAMALGMRSMTMAAVAMVPNIIPVGLTFAAMVVFGFSFDTNSAFVACIGIGIAVDDTIHIISRYQRAREHGSPSPRTALQYALTHAGMPVVLNSVLLAVGFSVLTLSTFIPTVRVGLLSVVLVLFAMTFDLFLLPVLLIFVDRLGGEFEPDEMAKPSTITGKFEEAAPLLTTPPQPPAKPAKEPDTNPP